MNRLLLAALLPIAACSQPLTPAQTAAGQTLVSVASATMPGVATPLADGQLLCSVGQTLQAVVDAATGKPFLVTGKAAQTVANVCAVIGGVPVAPPTVATTVPAKAVAVPAA